MANVITIRLGSRGCLDGSQHDSTCQCEGCVEKRLAAHEFSLTTTENFGERDYGFNVGDEGGPDTPGEIIVLTDDDDDGTGSVSDIFEINYHDEPSDDDTGYGDDGQDSEDAYSVFSPRPYHSSSEEEESDSDIEEEDMPLENIMHNSSIEASKRDGESVNTCVAELDQMEHPTIQQRKLQTFIDEHHSNDDHTPALYEHKIMSMFKQLSKYAEVIHAAKRRMDYDAFEISRLRDLCMEKTQQANNKDKELYDMANDMGRLALRHNQLNDRQLNSIRTLRQRLRDERKKSATLEEELHFTRKRLLTHTRRSVPRRSKRVRRMVDTDNESTITAGSNSDTDVEHEERRNIALVNAMMDLETAS